MNALILIGRIIAERPVEVSKEPVETGAHPRASCDNLIRISFENSEELMTDLAERQCVPCRGGVPAMKGAELETLAAQVPGWQVVNEHHLSRNYQFKDFREALDFVNRIGELAEEQGHHPDICFGWGKAEISIWTHKIDGLTESDFVLAAKIDKL
ncbi:MAG: 4a-hydroxytetrahydrobiopterin dehydratase [Pyrinomonadaceae bacterium]